MAEGYDKLVIFHGCLSDLGRSFATQLAAEPRTLTVLSTRASLEHMQPHVFAADYGQGVQQDACFITNAGINPEVCRKLYRSMIRHLMPEVGKPAEVYFVYGIGPMRMEIAAGQPTVSPQYASIDRSIRDVALHGFQRLANVLYRELREHARDTGQEVHLKLASFGSVRDKLGMAEDPKLCTSLWIAKNSLRRRLDEIVAAASRVESPVKVCGLMVSTSSIDTIEHRKLRPNVDPTWRANWLTTDEVAETTLRELKSLQPGQYRDRDLSHGNPLRPVSFADMLANWARDTGLPLDAPRPAIEVKV